MKTGEIRKIVQKYQGTKVKVGCRKLLLLSMMNGHCLELIVVMVVKMHLTYAKLGSRFYNNYV